MAVLKGTLTDSAGAPISGADVHVYLKDTTTPATLYSDFEMTVQTTNPLVSEADGAYLCYVADGFYDLVFNKTNVTFDASDSVDEMAFDGPAFKIQKAAANGLASLDANTRLTEAANKISDGTNNLHMKIIDIGDWNMDATISVFVTHGLTKSKIRDVQGIIRNDDDTYSIPITPGMDAQADAEIYVINSTQIGISRLAGGYYDNTAYDSTSYNRGWITIWYVE